MQQAGVDLGRVGVFRWARLEPREGEFDFAWLDEVLDLLHDGGIAVDLATATASPPPWLTRAHPEILPVDWRRQGAAPGRPAGTGAELAGLPRARAARCRGRWPSGTATHPALALWHVYNELGCHNALRLLRRRRRRVPRAGCERATARSRRSTAPGAPRSGRSGTATSTRCCPRGIAPDVPEPDPAAGLRAVLLRRAAGDYRARARRAARGHPGRAGHHELHGHGHAVRMDYFSWADDIDVVANDHYLGPRPAGRTSSSRSPPTSRAGSPAASPWLLMEHSTSAVNWQPRQRRQAARARCSGDSLRHVARGADAVCFFQWRAVAAGAEKFHSAMLPHAGHGHRACGARWSRSARR